MKNKFLTGAFVVGTLAVATLGAVGSAEAIVISQGTVCSAYTPVNPNVNIAQAVTPNLGCQIGTDNNDKVQNPLQVNKDGIFNFDDWKFLGKDGEEGTIDISAAFPTTNTLSGTWDITGLVQSTWTDVMLVFKGGDGIPIRPDDCVAYLIRSAGSGSLTGTWKSPFFNINSTKATGVSHISLYYREAEVVPTPAAVLPGLVGMGLAAFRKKKQEEEVAQDA